MISNCLLPVAGFGTRFLPVTKSIPKEMIPILTKPLIHYGVEESMDAGLNLISIVTSKHKDAIKKYFENSSIVEKSLKGTDKEFLLNGINNVINSCDFSFAEQAEMKGLGHAIYSGKEIVGNKPFAVLLPDDLCFNEGDSVLKQMVEVHKHYPDCCIVAIEEVPISEVHKYGIISGELIDQSKKVFRVQNMVEKPSRDKTPSNLAIIGRYILSQEIFKILENTRPDHNGEIQITDALMQLAKNGKVIAYKFDGKRFDCGSVRGYLDANNFFAAKENI